MGVFTDERQAKADRYNAARQRTVERFLNRTYYERKAGQDLITRISTETAEDYVLRQKGYRVVIERLLEETGAFRDRYYGQYEAEPAPVYLVTAKLLDQEYAYLEICLRIVEENMLRAEDASFYANRLAWIMRKVRKGWLQGLAKQHDLPDEVKRFIARV